MGEGAKGLEGEMQGTMEYFASFGLGFLRNLLIHGRAHVSFHLWASSFSLGQANSGEREREGAQLEQTRLVTSAFLFCPDSSSIHQTGFLR